VPSAHQAQVGVDRDTGGTGAEPERRVVHRGALFSALRGVESVELLCPTQYTASQTLCVRAWIEVSGRGGAHDGAGVASARVTPLLHES
jgi:hypothetical protein